MIDDRTMHRPKDSIGDVCGPGNLQKMPACACQDDLQRILIDCDERSRQSRVASQKISGYRPRLDLLEALICEGLAQIAIGLQIHPELRGKAKIGTETECSIRADGSLALNDRIDPR
jgi:hypothetical protein